MVGGGHFEVCFCLSIVILMSCAIQSGHENGSESSVVSSQRNVLASPWWQKAINLNPGPIKFFICYSTVSTFITVQFQCCSPLMSMFLFERSRIASILSVTMNNVGSVSVLFISVFFFFFASSMLSSNSNFKKDGHTITVMLEDT